MPVKKQQLEPDMEQQTGSKLGKEHIKAVYCHPAYAALDEAQAGIKIVGRNINNLRRADDTTLLAKREELNSLLMKVKEESKKAGLKFHIQKKIMASGSITSGQIEGEKWKQGQLLFSWAPITVALKLKDACPLEGKQCQT